MLTEERLKELTPFKYQDGCVCDKDGNTLIKANRESGTTPLSPAERDDLMFLIKLILNKALF